MASQLQPIDRFEMNRMAHARAQEIHLPGSAPGQSGHKHLRQAAWIHYQKRSWSDLDVGQMKSIYDFLDKHKRMPIKGELGK